LARAAGLFPLRQPTGRYGGERKPLGDRLTPNERSPASPTYPWPLHREVRLGGGGNRIRTSGPTFKEDSRTPSSPLRSFGAWLHRLRSFLSPRTTTSNSRHPKVISLVEPREETWDGKAERKDGTGHRLDRRGRPARRSRARASRRARASAGRDAERGARVVADIEASGGVADFLAADLSALAEVRSLADARPRRRWIGSTS
jgi:hypothetical protein